MGKKYSFEDFREALLPHLKIIENQLPEGMMPKAREKGIANLKELYVRTAYGFEEPLRDFLYLQFCYEDDPALSIHLSASNQVKGGSYGKYNKTDKDIQASLTNADKGCLNKEGELLKADERYGSTAKHELLHAIHHLYADYKISPAMHASRQLDIFHTELLEAIFVNHLDDEIPEEISESPTYGDMYEHDMVFEWLETHDYKSIVTDDTSTGRTEYENIYQDMQTIYTAERAALIEISQTNDVFNAASLIRKRLPESFSDYLKQTYAHDSRITDSPNPVRTFAMQVIEVGKEITFLPDEELYQFSDHLIDSEISKGNYTSSQDYFMQQEKTYTEDLDESLAYDAARAIGDALEAIKHNILFSHWKDYSYTDYSDAFHYADIPYTIWEANSAVEFAQKTLAEDDISDSLRAEYQRKLEINQKNLEDPVFLLSNTIEYYNTKNSWLNKSLTPTESTAIKRAKEYIARLTTETDPSYQEECQYTHMDLMLPHGKKLMEQLFFPMVEQKNAEMAAWKPELDQEKWYVEPMQQTNIQDLQPSYREKLASVARQAPQTHSKMP